MLINKIQLLCCIWRLQHRMLGVFNARNAQHTTPSSRRTIARHAAACAPAAPGYQAQLAERLGISQQSYARLETRPAATSVARLSKLLRVLNAD